MRIVRENQLESGILAPTQADPSVCHGADVNRFSSMGCEVVVEDATAAELARIRLLFEERDAVFSRFRENSELNRVNAAGQAFLVSPHFAEMVEAALRAREQTGGLVDPTLGAALEAAGYDRDFEALEPSEAAALAGGEPGTVELYGRVLLLGRGVKLDLNGVVKAAAVDDAVRVLSGPGFVSAGGDLATRGEVDVALARRRRRAARLRRARHERPHEAALDARRGRAAPPDRSRDRAAVGHAVGGGHGLRRDLPCCRRRGQGGVPARRGRARLARRARAPGSVPGWRPSP